MRAAALASILRAAAPAAVPAAVAAQAQAHSRRPGPLSAAVADRALVERVLSASRVERRPSPPDASYLADFWAAVLRAVARAIERAAAVLHLGENVWLVVVAAAVVAALAVLVAAIVRRWRPGRRPGPPAGGLGRALPAGASAEWDAAAWRRDVERRLALGEVQGALSAVWWWLARSLAGSLAEPTWTGRELLSRANREDLRGLVRRLDLLTYGPRSATLDDVRGLFASLDAVVA